MRKEFERKYLAEFVYGGIDGTVTTFTVIAVAVGASLETAIILIFGFANLFADGFSMAISNYLSTKSQKELNLRHRYKYLHEKDPRKTALATFIAFVVVGSIPLISFIVAPISPAIDNHKFLYASILTAIAFLIIGAVKGEIVEKNKVISALETLTIGGIAAFIAFTVGYLLQGIVTN